MLRRAFAFLLAALMVLSGLILADARGQMPVTGTLAVICSGTTLTTVTLGPDGRPVEKPAPCPDGTALFAATFSLPVIALPAGRLSSVLAPARPTFHPPETTLPPSARDPPGFV